MYNNPIDLELNILKYGPTINMVIAELNNTPNINIPLGSAPKTAPEIPNTINIAYIIEVTTALMTTVMIINPKYVAMHLNHPISSTTFFI